jgi:hypothetical protein
MNTSACAAGAATRSIMKEINLFTAHTPFNEFLEP